MTIEKRWYLICDDCGQRSDDWYATKREAECGDWSAGKHPSGFVRTATELLCDSCAESG